MKNLSILLVVLLAIMLATCQKEPEYDEQAAIEAFIMEEGLNRVNISDLPPDLELQYYENLEEAREDFLIQKDAMLAEMAETYILSWHAPFELMRIESNASDLRVPLRSDRTKCPPPDCKKKGCYTSSSWRELTRWKFSWCQDEDGIMKDLTVEAQGLQLGWTWSQTKVYSYSNSTACIDGTAIYAMQIGTDQKTVQGSIAVTWKENYRFFVVWEPEICKFRIYPSYDDCIP